MSAPHRPLITGPSGLGSELSGTPTGPAPPASRFVRSLSGQLGSQALLAAVGLASLPLLARNLGPGRYANFSLAIAILGLTSQLDLVRPRFVRSFSRGEVDRAELETLWTLDLLLVTGLATLIATIGLSAVAAIPVGLGALCFAAASREYALLAARGRVGTATAVRNIGWACATLGAVVVTSVQPAGWAWLWCFPAANFAILIVYRELLAGIGEPVHSLPGIGWDGAAWSRLVREVRDLLGHGLSVLVLGSADKLMLERRAAESSTGGMYMGQYDLAVKVHVISTALGATLYPLLSRSIQSDGQEVAARRFLGFASKVAIAYFIGLALMIGFHEQLVRFVLGADFAPAAPLFAWMLPGVFLAHFGFLFTPWQRARGDFASQRRAYGTGTLVMLVVGVIAIPSFEAAGAVATYLAARAAECLLLLGERRSLGTAHRPTARLACAAGMAFVLFALAWFHTGGSEL
jgi:O-antigen/teichoic acid export membrane protein